MHQGWTARFQSFGWFFGIKIIKQNIVHVKHKYALSCFTQRSPVSKIWSSLVNITVWLGLPRLNTIYSWASHIYFSCHSDLAWTGTPGSVVRSCKYPSSKTSGEFFCFNWVVFQSLFSKTYSIRHLWNLCCNLWAESCVPPELVAFCALYGMESRLSRLLEKPTLWARLEQTYVEQCSASQGYTRPTHENAVCLGWVLCLYKELLFGVYMGTRFLSLL